MTSKNMSWRTKPSAFKDDVSCGVPAKPFLLKPVGKDYLWGGNRLNTDFAKEIAMSPLAETWECSTHPDGTSTVDSGEFAGRPLSDVLKEHPKFLGSHPRTKDELPILIKLIDAQKDLSVQVHPSDEYAAKHENGSLGKSEMWYVLDAASDTKLVYGFYHDMDEEKLRASLISGTVEKYLQKVPVKKDDVFFIEAGRVHAIGAGALIAEIQESSNLTYRLYDYNRLDKNGKRRELHIDKVLAVADLKSSREPRQPLRVLRYQKGCARELLCRCKYFQVERMLLNTLLYGVAVPFQTGPNSFQVLLCTEGSGMLSWEQKASADAAEHVYNEEATSQEMNASCEVSGNRNKIDFKKGDCIFIPANSVGLQLEGAAQLLNVSC